MTKEEIKTIIELFISWNGETEVIDISNLDSAVDYIHQCIRPLQSDVTKAAADYARCYTESDNGNGGDDWEDDISIAFTAGAKWQMAQMMKDGERHELTWEDIEAIDQIFTDVFKDGFDVITDNYYQEVLKRFKGLKHVK